MFWGCWKTHITCIFYSALFVARYLVYSPQQQNNTFQATTGMSKDSSTLINQSNSLNKELPGFWVAEALQISVQLPVSPLVGRQAGKPLC